MFPSIIKNCLDKIDTVQKILESNDSIRRAIADSNSVIGINQDQFPTLTEWRIYDHCSAITRLYAIYENFVEEILSSMLTLLPEFFVYKDLGSHLHDAHRNGISFILQRMNWNRHKSISEVVLLKEYYEAISEQTVDYVINPIAMLYTEQNFKLNILENLFRRVTVENLVSWLTSHKDLKNFMTNVRGEATTVESELTSFIDYRNEASHGVVSNVLGKGCISKPPL